MGVRIERSFQSLSPIFLYYLEQRSLGLDNFLMVDKPNQHQIGAFPLNKIFGDLLGYQVSNQASKFSPVIKVQGEVRFVRFGKHFTNLFLRIYQNCKVLWVINELKFSTKRFNR